MNTQKLYREPAEKILATDIDHGPEVVPGQYLPNTVHHGYDNAHYIRQSEQPTPRARKICGLRRSTFYLVLILVVFVVGGSVGGGVGGSLAVLNARKEADMSRSTSAAAITTTSAETATAPGSPIETSSVTESGSPASTTAATRATTTVSPTSDSRLAVPTAGVLALDCPNISGKTTSVTVGSKSFSYDTECGVDNNGSEIDIIAVVSYSLHDCLLSCSSYNANGASVACAGVQFHADLADLVSRFSGNCFLKNRKGNAVVDTNSTNYNLHVSGMLST